MDGPRQGTRRGVGFLWELLRAIPAAATATGEVDRAEFDIFHGLSLLAEFTHAGASEVDPAAPRLVQRLPD
ncbi:hypothetical protein [Actinomadura bangladeshensis]|uniref:Uncharacterized protein n=1 Tax=Actinomadura bangladeshensis TaxID=453573 RepID=A0A6L9QSA0_9ACTN|nr:hypothetical protein [Actinomadura bangladeshensis]NEA28311.1 hypothetical protein [Actinomadura bangladeshensis]